MTGTRVGVFIRATLKRGKRRVVKSDCQLIHKKKDSRRSEAESQSERKP